MKANELRIGNLFFAYGKTATLTSINCSHKEHEPHLFFNVDGDARRHSAFLNDKIRGIPLSQEWYARMGFEILPDWSDKRKDGSVAFLDLGYLFISCGMMGNSATLFDNNGLSTGIHFDFVHQIQNCYFALKSSELPISQPAPSGDKSAV